MDTTTQPPSSGPTARPSAPRRLTRSRDERMIAGVAGGIARHFGYDPTLVRLAIATLGVITFGTAFVAYVVAWVIMPEDDGHLVADELRARALRHRHGHRRGHMWFGIALFVAGLIALGDVGDFWGSDVLGPIVLIAIGCAVLFSNRTDSLEGAPPPEMPTPPTPIDSNPDESGSPPSASSDTFTPSASSDTTSSAYQSRTWAASQWHPGSEHHHDFEQLHRQRRRDRRERRVVRRLVWSAVALIIGTAWLLDASNAVDVNPNVIATLVLMTFGFGLVASGWYGRSRSLIIPALILTVICGTAASLTVRVGEGVGSQKYTPIKYEDVARRYEHGVGEFVLDLSGTSGNQPISTTVEIGIGELNLIVPDDADVRVDASVDLGAITAFGKTDDGGYHHKSVVESGGSGRTISITAKLGIGEIRIQRAADTDALISSPSPLPLQGAAV